MSLLDRITERRAELDTEADRLRKQLTDLEDELERMTIARQVVAQMLEDDPQLADDPGGVTYMMAAASPSVRMVISDRHEVEGPEVFPADYQQLLAAVTAAGGPVRCKQLCEQLDLGTEPRHVEAVRAKLKRLEDRGWLRRNGAGMFTAPP